MSVTVVGTVFVDIKGYPYGKYIPDGRNSGYMMQVHGGVGRNIAEDIANMGAKVKLVSLTDGSPLAAQVKERLIKSGVDITYVKDLPDGMGKWMAIFNEKGDVEANISIRPDLKGITDIINEKHDDIFRNTDGILIEVDMEKETVEAVFKYASMYNKRVYSCVSVMSIALDRLEYIKRSECFVCNLQEAEMLFGEKLESRTTDEIEKIVREKAVQTGIKSIIVTLGERGSVYTDKNGKSGNCPAKKAELVDSTGAGDAFFAGAALSLTRQDDMEKACHIGTMAAAKVIESKENVCPVFRVD